MPDYYLQAPLKKKICLVLVFLFLPVLVQAQQYNFRNWSIEHGLPQAQVTDILQDNKGQLWLATQGGVSRFNGTSFQTYTSARKLRGNNTKCIFQDSRGRIWVGTKGSGITIVSDSALQQATNTGGLQTGDVHQMAEDKAGVIWFATDSGMYSFKNRTFSRSVKFPVQAYKAVLCAPSGDLWAGSASHGIFVARKNTVVHYTRHKNLPSNNITCLAQNKNEPIWIGTDKGVAHFTQGALKELPLPASVAAAVVSDFTHDTYGNTWIGFENDGLLRYDGKNFTHVSRKNGLKTNKIASLASDREGNVWIGTDGYGLQQFKNPCFTHYFEFDQVQEPKITALANGPNGRMWFGTASGSVGFRENNKFQWLKQKPWPEGTTINYIRADVDGETWFCTNKGIWQIKQGSQGVKHFSSDDGLPSDIVFYCATDSEGKLWVATARGVASLQGSRFTALAGPDPGEAYVLLLDRKKQLWLGAENGIYQISDSKIAEVPELARLKPTDIETIAQDTAGNLYFGGFNHGLYRLDKSRKEATYYNHKQGLPQESLHSLYVDHNNNLWAGTNTSILKIRLKSLRRQNKLDYRTYSYHDGFRGIEVGRNTIAQASDSSIWFGTAKGLTHYNHALDARNTTHPQTFFTDIQLFMQPTPWEEMGFKTDTATGLPIKPRLQHDQNHLTFNYQGICMTGPERVRYKYKLKGYSENWSAETKQPFISFANLAPGSYTFELLAKNNDGYWTPAPLSYSFSIMPPLWQRKWFLGLLLLVLIASVVSLVRLREKSLLKYNLLLEQKVRHRTQLLEEKNKEKEILLKEVHHRVKNNLQIVISLLNQQVRHTTSPEATNVMQAVRNRVRSMAILHERLYQHSDLTQIDLNHYFTQICDSLYASFGVTKEKIELNIAVPHIKVDIDSAITLGLIVNEIISNALKYAFKEQKDGLLQIIMESYDSHSYTLVISDNGPGLPAEMAQQHRACFGLQLVNSLIRKLQGTATFKNNAGTKAILSFKLPS